MAAKRRSAALKLVLAFALTFLMVWSGLPIPALAEMQEELSEVSAQGAETPAQGSETMGEEPGATLTETPAPAEAPTTAETPVPEPTTLSATAESQRVTKKDPVKNTELFGQYVQGKVTDAQPTQDPAQAKERARDGLSELDGAVYDALKPLVTEVADGTRKNTQFSFNVGKFTSKTQWTAQDLGVGAIVEQDGTTQRISQAATQAALAQIAGNLVAVNDALLADMPSELYWYDVVSGMDASGVQLNANKVDGEWVLEATGDFAYRFAVASDYADKTGEYLVDDSLVKAAIEDAKAAASPATPTQQEQPQPTAAPATPTQQEQSQPTASSNSASGQPKLVLGTQDDDLVNLSTCAVTCPFVTIWDGNLDLSELVVTDEQGQPVESDYYAATPAGSLDNVQKGQSVTINITPVEGYSTGSNSVTCTVGLSFDDESIQVEGGVFTQSQYEDWQQFDSWLPLRISRNGEEIAQYGYTLSQKSYDEATGALQVELVPPEDSMYYGSRTIGCKVLPEGQPIDISGATVVFASRVARPFMGDSPYVNYLVVPIDNAGTLLIGDNEHGKFDIEYSDGDASGVVTATVTVLDEYASEYTGSATGKLLVVDPSTYNLAADGVSVELYDYNTCDSETGERQWLLRDGGVTPVATLNIECEYEGEQCSFSISAESLDKCGISVAYANNTAAGTGTVTLSNSTSSTAPTPFKIIDQMNLEKFSLNGTYLSDMLARSAYVVSDPMPEPKIKEIPGLFEEGKDFEYIPLEDEGTEYYNYVPEDYGNYWCSFRIRAKGGQSRYTGEALVSTTIYNLKDFNKCSLEFVHPEVSYVYNGDTQKAPVQLLDENGQVLFTNEGAENETSINDFVILYVFEEGGYYGLTTVTVRPTAESGYAGDPLQVSYVIQPLPVTTSNLSYSRSVSVNETSLRRHLEKNEMHVNQGNLYMGLTYGRDYTITSDNFVPGTPGRYEATITFKGGFSGTLQLPFTCGRDLEDTERCYVYDFPSLLTTDDLARIREGDWSPWWPSVSFAGYPLEENTDYTLTIQTNAEETSGSFVITGIGDCIGTRTVDFVVSDTAKTFDHVGVEAIPDQVYNGSPITPEVVVRDTDTNLQLQLNRDYTLSYEDNVECGRATITITGAGDYVGTMWTHFNIRQNQPPAEDAVWWGGDEQCIWWIDAQYKLVVAPANGTSGTLLTDEYGNWPYGWQEHNFAVSTVEFRPGVKARGALCRLFWGTNISNAETIDLTNLDAADVTNISDLFHNLWYLESITFDPSFANATITDASCAFAYCENLRTLDLSALHTTPLTNMEGAFTNVQLESFTIANGYAADATGALPLSPVHNGEWWSEERETWMTNAQIAALGSSAGGTYTTHGMSAVPTDIWRATIDSIPSQKYTGEAIEPSVSLTYEGTPLALGTDYTVEYSNNTDVGYATVTITGIGNYTGTTTIDFQIYQNRIYVGQTEYTAAASGAGANGGTWVWDGDSGLTLTGYNGDSIVKDGPLDVTLEGDNVVRTGLVPGPMSAYGHFTAIATKASGGLSISGDGTLLADASGITADMVSAATTYDGDSRLEAISSEGGMTIDGVGSLRVVGATDTAIPVDFVCAIHSELGNDVEILNGSFIDIDLVAQKNCSVVYASRDLRIVDSTLLMDASSETSKVNYTHYGLVTESAYNNGFQKIEFQNSVVDINTINLRPINTFGSLSITNSDVTLNVAEGEEGQLAVAAGDIALSQVTGAQIVDTELFAGRPKTLKTGDSLLNVVLTHTGAASQYENGVQDTVVKQSLTGATVTVADSNVFGVQSVPVTWPHTGSAIEPLVMVKLGEATLTEGRDYEVTYQNNVDVGEATAIVTGIGHYEGEIRAPFMIASHMLFVDGNVVSSPAIGNGSQGGTWTWDGAEALTLNGYKGGEIKAYGKLDLTLVGASEVEGISVRTPYWSHAADEDSTLNIAGTGSVRVTAGDNPRDEGIAARVVSIDGATVVLDSCLMQVEQDLGFDQPSTLTVKNGANVTVDDGRITVMNGSFSIADSTVNIAQDDGAAAAIFGFGQSEVRNSRLSVTAGGVGIQVPAGMTISNSDVSVTSSSANAIETFGSGITFNQVTAAELVRPETENARPYVDTGSGNKSVAMLHIGTKSNYANGVQDASLNDAVVTAIPNATYTGEPFEPAVEVKLGEVTIPSDCYSVQYVDNTNAGTATVNVTGTNNFSGSTSTTFVIRPADITTATFALPACDLPSGLYTEKPGEPLTPVPTITWNERQLSSGTDFALTYDNNELASADGRHATVTATGTGNFEGTLEGTFVIYKYSGTVGDEPAAGQNRVIWHVNAEGALVVEPKEPGEATIGNASDPGWTAEGPAGSIRSATVDEGVVGCTNTAGFFKGCTSLTSVDLSEFGTSDVTNTSEMFAGCTALSGLDLSTLDLRKVTDSTDMFTGSGLQAFTLGENYLPQNADVSMIPASPASNGLWWSVDDGAWLSSEQVIAFGADAAGAYRSVGSIDATTVTLDKTSYDYDGNAKEPVVTVKLGDVELTKDTDYEVSYRNNVQPGSATVVVSGTGLYEGTKTASFSISGTKPTPLATTRDGVDWSAVYDPIYYATKNGDVTNWARRADGTIDGDKLLQHFVNNGAKEGRPSKADFELASYYNANADLRGAFGTTDWSKYYRHYVTNGAREGRTCSGVGQLVSPVALRDGVDWSPVYDGAYYAAHNGDVTNWATRGFNSGSVVDDTALLTHFINSGSKEGRKGNATFELASYYNAHADLRRAFGTSDWSRYYRHYVTNGAREGRTCTGVDQLCGALTSRDGVDWSSVYDGIYYAQHNTDIANWASRKCGTDTVLDDAALLQHFVNNGAKEGRKGNATFELASYYNANGDLRRAYGTSDWSKYYRHYVTNGAREGRTCSGVDTLRGYASSSGGVDWAPVYDANVYASQNSDVASWARRSFSSGSVLDDAALLSHFVGNGAKEGRRSKAEFELASYYNANGDLRRAFGTSDWSKYYRHYATNGAREGRTSTGVSQLRGFVTTSGGVDWAPVYDANEYATCNPDLASWARRSFNSGFVLDDAALLSHFVNSGQRERRQAKSTFNVTNYRSRYSDLKRAFGDDWPRYYRHFATNGFREGRVGA